MIKVIIKILSYPFIKLFFLLFPIRIYVNSLQETLQELISSNSSIIRLGDGELKIIDGKSIYFQSYSEELAKKLQEILESNYENLIIALPDIFNNFSHLTTKAKLFWLFDLFLRQKNYRNINNKKNYGNAFLSRPYMDYRDKKTKKNYFEQLKNLWNKKDILFIEGKTSRNGVGNDLYSNTKSIKRIICPSSDAYKYKNEILDFVMSKIPKDILIFLSLGPAAKAIGYELFQKGYRIIDIGHLDSEYEWCLSGTKKKIKITGKHTAELEDNNISSCNDYNYLSQIIYEVC